MIFPSGSLLLLFLLLVFVEGLIVLPNRENIIDFVVIYSWPRKAAWLHVCLCGIQNKIFEETYFLLQ